MLCAAGCSRAPTFNILGSFFPAWILCGVDRHPAHGHCRGCFFVRIKLEQELSPLILVYPVPGRIFHIHAVAAVLQLILRGDAMPENDTHSAGPNVSAEL